jgi:hypothetical protein
MLIASKLGRSDFEVGLDVAERLAEKGALDDVVGEDEGLLVRLGRLRPLVQPVQEIGAGGAEIAVRGQRRIGQQRRQRIEASLRAVAEADRDRAVELDVRRRPQLE